MTNWEDSLSVPWRNYRASIKNVVINNGVTSISGGAFYDCSNLRSINIPSSITSINDAAFGGYVCLTHVYYGGSEAEWKEIKIGVKNEALTDTTIVITER